MEYPKNHRSGFVNILGRPNVGKSTLLNALVGERMSIITNKPQTTRHRIIALLSGPDFQIVFSDTPGVIQDPAYKMQEVMNQFVHSSFEDADLVLLVVDAEDKPDEDHPLWNKLGLLDAPVFLILNKTDLLTKEKEEALLQKWRKSMLFKESMALSALEKQGTDELLEKILENLPPGPVYYPKDQLTDRPERFFISEIVREKILEQYHQEIPYSVQVEVESFKETETKHGEPLVKISAIIYTARPTQKSILIGKGGSGIKKLGMEARKSMESFLDKKVFLELFVKVKDNWRDDDQWLKQFGYVN